MSIKYLSLADKHDDALDWPSASERLKDLCPRPLVYEGLESIYRLETIQYMLFQEIFNKERIVVI